MATTFSRYPTHHQRIPKPTHHQRIPKAPTARILSLVILYVSAAIFASILISDSVYPIIEDSAGKITAAISIISLSSLPVILGFVHNTSRTRQLDRLHSIRPFPVAKTYYYKSAVIAIRGLKIASFESGYVVPILTLFATIFMFSSALFSAPWFESFFSQKAFILGGVSGINMDEKKVIISYQHGTFLCGMMAFVGSYIYMIGRLWDRINNNDIYPISYYYYAARMILSYFVAIIIRHTLSIFGLADGNFLVLVGFVIGLTPDFFVVALSRKAYQAFKIYGSKSDPKADNRRPAMPLLMLDDITREKIDRLGELGIDNAQILACQNPFLIWPRLPYNLGLIIDWIAQAQLYTLVGESGLKNLRETCVYDIFDLYLRLSDEKARKETCHILQIGEDAAPVIVRQLDEDQSFTQLRQVRDKMAVS